jgi:hypothetical protein
MWLTQCLVYDKDINLFYGNTNIIHVSKEAGKEVNAEKVKVYVYVSLKVAGNLFNDAFH